MHFLTDKPEFKIFPKEHMPDSWGTQTELAADGTGRTPPRAGTARSHRGQTTWDHALPGHDHGCSGCSSQKGEGLPARPPRPPLPPQGQQEASELGIP